MLVIQMDRVGASFTIGTTRIDEAGPAWVIAELSGNHGGSVDQACRLIQMAGACGASAVKLVKRTNQTLYTCALLAQPYHSEHAYGPTYGTHREALEFGRDAYLQCREVADLHHLTLFATAYDEAALEFLVELDMPAIKIHSGGLTDEPLLRAAAQTGRPLLVSTGGGTVADMDRAHTLLQHSPHAFLHCTAAYPLLPQEANLRTIMTMRRRYPDTVIGFSSHSPGIMCSLVAYAFGARIIEHHITLNRASKGSDQAFSLERKGLQTLVEDLGKLRLALGDGIKCFYESERAPIAKMRRHQTAEGWRIDGECLS